MPVYPPGPLSGEHGTLIPYRDTGFCAQQRQHRGGIRTSKNDFFQLFFLPLLADLSLDTVSSIVKYIFKLLSDQNRKKYSGIHDCFQSVKQGECYKILSHPSFWPWFAIYNLVNLTSHQMFIGLKRSVSLPASTYVAYLLVLSSACQHTSDLCSICTWKQKCSVLIIHRLALHCSSHFSWRMFMGLSILVLSS